MTLTMRNYGLVLPKNYVSIEKDEMEYIDGGIYLSRITCLTLASAAGIGCALGKAGIQAISAYLVAKGTTLAAKVIAMASSLGPVGTIIAAVGTVIIASQIISFMIPVVVAIANGTGCSMDWFFVFHNYKYY